MCQEPGGTADGRGADSAQPWADPEIARLEAELATLSDALAGAEAELLDTRLRLERLAVAHDRRMAPLYAELAEIRARIAELRARDGRPENIRAAEQARAGARASATAAEEALGYDVDQDAEDAAMSVVPPTVGRLFRRLARLCHPDLAQDEADRTRREDFMRRVNDAYRRRDLDELHRLEAEWFIGGEPVAPSQTGTDRIVVLRAAVATVRRRLAEVQAEHAALAGSPLGRMLFDPRHEGDPRRGLDELARVVRLGIRREREVLQRLSADRG